jgi:hypothetical protein
MSDSDLVLNRGLNKSKCRSCKKEVTWAYTTGGKKAPFEADEKGEWVLENGTARHVGPVPSQLELGAPAPEQRYTNHFATCPQAVEWRQPK